MQIQIQMSERGTKISKMGTSQNHRMEIQDFRQIRQIRQNHNMGTRGSQMVSQSLKVEIGKILGHIHTVVIRELSGEMIQILRIH